MLILGETVLSNRLSTVGFLGYWVLCFLCTFVAIVVAFLDVRETQQRVRAEQREFLDDALREIQEEAKNKRQKVRKNGH